MNSKRVHAYLEILVNQPLNSVERVANMACFGFGRCIQNGNENLAETNLFSLHVQCAWRIEDKKNKEILFAYSDIYSPNSSTAWTKSFNWDTQGVNLFDEKAKEWIRSNQGIVVNEFRLSMYGDLLLLSNGNVLDVFVDASTKEECWRLFEVGSKKEHFVVNGQGIVFEYDDSQELSDT